MPDPQPQEEGVHFFQVAFHPNLYNYRFLEFQYDAIVYPSNVQVALILFS